MILRLTALTLLALNGPTTISFCQSSPTGTTSLQGGALSTDSSASARRVQQLESGEHQNTSPFRQVVHSVELIETGARAMRLFFAEVDLGPDDCVLVTSLRDLEEHRLTPEELRKWNFSSAWLNGEHLLLELELAAGSRGSWRLESAAIETRPPLFSLCGLDDRQPTSDGRVVRLLSAAGADACTGFVVSDDDCVVTAGHCLPSFGASAEINAPLSQADGSLNHPPVADQFAIIQTSLQFQNLGIGSDWGVLNLERNVLGQRIYELYGAFTLATTPPSPGALVALAGYGDAPGGLNQTLQTDSGILATVSGTYVTYPADTESGSSGSPVMLMPSETVIGIHAVGSCSQTFNNNGGTAVWDPSLIAAVQSACFTPPPAPPVAIGAVSSGSAITGQPVRFIDTSIGEIDVWSWDFNGDGQTDSSLPNPTFAYDSPGTYNVSLVVSNTLGSDTWSSLAAVTVRPVTPASLGLLERFEGTFPPNDAWYFASSNNAGTFSAQIYGATSPQDGGQALHLFSAQNGTFVTNDAAVALDVSGSVGVLSWWFRDIGDEDNVEDGVFLSDGNTEIMLQSHQGLTSNWTRFEVDLAPHVAALGSPAQVWVIFRQRDNWGLGSDGHGFDEVRYEAASALTMTPDTLSTAAGGVGVLELNAGLSEAGRSFVLLGSRLGTTPPATIFGVTIPLRWHGYTNATLLYPNGGERQGFQGILDATGRATATVSMPPGFPLAGTVLHYAFVTLEPGMIRFVSHPVSLTLAP